MWTSCSPKMRFAHENVIYLPAPSGCEYGAFRAPPLPYPPLTQELPDMADTANLMLAPAPNGPGLPGSNPNAPHLGHLVSTNSNVANGNNVMSSNSSNTSSSGGSPNSGGMIVATQEGLVMPPAPPSPTSTILTVRMIMQGKEVGSIIGKKGDNIKKFREDSGAKINISDGSCPERIVTVTGTTDSIQRAFGFICKKFEEQDLQNVPTTPKPPVTLRLVVPASQCGSLIGKQGCKIKEIREATGASIQVASEMLPNSTERAVTVSGTADAITQCIKYVCGIMLELNYLAQMSPPKGANLPYRPKPLLSPVYISNTQGFTMPPSCGPIPGQEALNALQYDNFRQRPNHFETFPTSWELPKGLPHPVPLTHAIPMVPSTQTVVPGSLIPVNGLSPAAFPPLSWPGPLPPPPTPPPLPPSCLSLGHSLQYSPRPNPQGPPGPPALQGPPGQQAQEMNIPNDLIGCIIGRGGQKINEIRQVSGANIKISNAEDGSSDRKVTITGSPECIGLAQYLISTSMELHKTLTLDPSSLTPVSSMGAPMPPPQPHPMAMTVVKSLPPPTAMLGLNPLGQFIDPATLGAPSSPLGAPGAPLTSMALTGSLPTGFTERKPLTTKMRLGLTATTAFSAAERPKFAPY